MNYATVQQVAPLAVWCWLGSLRIGPQVISLHHTGLKRACLLHCSGPPCHFRSVQWWEDRQKKKRNTVWYA